MQDSFSIIKVLNNNVLMAETKKGNEVILIGGGLGFGKKKGEDIDSSSIEKMFVLQDPNEQEQYKKLLPFVPETLIEAMTEVMHFIEKRMKTKLNEHIHIALTDHISFALKRIQEGLDIKNPFSVETKHLYPEEYQIAEEVVKILAKKTNLVLPEGEVGFIALHIHSAIAEKSISEVSKYNQLIAQLIGLIENHLEVEIDRNSVNYMRLIRHLQFTIQRVKNGEEVEEPEKITLVLKEEYPVCYNLAWKLIKVLQNALDRKVYEAEAVYLTMHLRRFSNKFK